MTLPIAALGAIVAAVVETSVAPEMTIAGAQVDLVLTLAVLAAVLIGVEDGLAWAFVGGLMLDLLVPARPMGTTTLSLLLVVGSAVIVARAPGPRRLVAVGAVFLLTWAFHLVMLAVLAAAEGVSLATFQPQLVLSAAIQNSFVAVLGALILAALGRRFAPDRADW